LVVGNDGGRAYLSTDSGSNWSAISFPSGVTTGNWYCAAASGTNLVVGNDGGRAYLSTDSGSNWSAISFPSGVTTGNWYCAAASGTNLVVGNYYNAMLAYLSTDNGSNWAAIQATEMHILSLATSPTISAGTAYHQDWFVKYVTGGRSWVYLKNTIANKTAWFNVQYGYWGTIDANVSVNNEALSNGFYRISAGCTSSSTTDKWVIGTSSADNITAYIGDGRIAVIVFGHNITAGSFMTSYIPRLTDTAASRSADSLTFLPYKLTNSLNAIVSPAPTMWLDFTQDPSGSTITDNSGTYTLTKAGRPKHYTSAVYGDYHKFDGASDYYTFASSALYPASSNFSIVAVFTPESISGGTTTIMSALGSDGSYYELDQINDGIRLLTYDGTGSTNVTKTTCLIAKKPSLITIIFTRAPTVTDSVCNIYVDALSVANSTTMRKIGGSFSSGSIARWTGGGQLTYGILNYLAYYNSAITSTDHTNMYTALKQANVLPLGMGSSYPYKKLRIRGEYKYIGSASAAAAYPIVSIGGSIGSAASNKNYVNLYMSGTTFFASMYENGTITERFMSKTSVTHNIWNSFDVTFNLSDLASSFGTFNSVAMTIDGTLTGSDKNLVFLDTTIRLGQDYAGTTTGYCYVRNLLIGTE
jgi:hypothetical protein